MPFEPTPPPPPVLVVTALGLELIVAGASMVVRYAMEHRRAQHRRVRPMGGWGEFRIQVERCVFLERRSGGT